MAYIEFVVPDSNEKEWAEEVAKKLANSVPLSTYWSAERQRVEENYAIYDGKFNKDDFKYITEMYGVAAPARLVNYPLIKPKIELLIGEFVTKPLKFTVRSVNDEALNTKFSKYITQTVDYFARQILHEITEEIGINIMPDIITQVGMEVIKEIGRGDWRDANEVNIEKSLQYLNELYDFKHVFKQCLLDVLICGKAFVKIVVDGDTPTIERIHPLNIYYDPSVGSDLEDSPYVIEEAWLPLHVIVNRYSAFIEDKGIKGWLKELADPQKAKGMDNRWYYYDGSGTWVKVYRIEWKAIRWVSLKKLAQSEEDESFAIYSEEGGGDEQKVPIVELWEAIVVGVDKVIMARPVPGQQRTQENLSTTRFTYSGVIKNGGVGTPQGIVDLLKNIQLLYNIVMYHIELTMARAGGKAIVYDLAQKPSNVPLSEIIYHLKNTGVIFINSMEEGIREARAPAMSEVDLTLSQSLTQLINLKIVLEQTAEALTGISRVREGFVSDRTPASSVQSAITQSSLMTMPVFYMLNKLMRDSLNRLVHFVKIYWGLAGGGRAKYFMSDAQLAYFKIDETVALNDYSVFVKIGDIDIEKKQFIMQVAAQAASSGHIDILQLIKLAKARDYEEAEKIFEEGVAAMQQLQQQLAQQQQQIEMMKAQLEQAKINAEIQKSMIAGETRVRAAEIEAKGRKEATMIKANKEKELRSIDADTDKKTPQSPPPPPI